jgi:signal transduction histidine kinase
VLERVRRRASGISRRLIASYVLVTVAAVVLVEGFVLGFEVPRLVGNAQLQAEVRGTAESYSYQLSQRYPDGVPLGTLLGVQDQRPDVGVARTTSDGTLIVPAIRGTISSHKVVTAVVAIAQGGTIIASSLPSRYPPGQVPGRELPDAALAGIRAGQFKGIGPGTGSTPHGSVCWVLYGRGSTPATSKAGGRAAALLYVEAPPSSGFVNPIQAWDELRQLAGSGVLFLTLLFAIVPIGVLFGVLVSRPLVRRVHRLERATVAATDGDYTTLHLPTSGRDELGRLEANVGVMTRQISSALAAERERATAEARAAERSRIAREIHDAISQHLFGLRMIAAGMRRADPDNEQVRAIERISEEAQRDMQSLLSELRPTGLDDDGLVFTLRRICTSYQDRLGIAVDADLTAVTVSEPVGHALLRVTQEACTNAVRHGHASQLRVSLARQNGDIELAIRDNGTGFDPGVSHAGSGLHHIRDRVTELGGTVKIESTPGSGAVVTVRVPAP